MLLVTQRNYLNFDRKGTRTNDCFDEPLRKSVEYRPAVIIGASVALLLLANMGFAQQGTGAAPPSRNQTRPNSSTPQQAKPLDSKRMEQEERRRLRQEIRRHGPEFRAKEVVPPPAPATSAFAPPAVSAAPASLPPPAATLTPPATLPPLPSYFGWPVVPASSPNPSASPNTGIGRGPALSQEERQQLRQQIRDERKRGQYPTPSEADR